MIKIKKRIKENKKLYGVLKIIQNIGNKEFKQYCLDFFINSKTLHFYKHGENNKGVLIYHINVGSSAVGMCSLITWTLRKLEFAEYFKLIPVVSWNRDIPFGNKIKEQNPFELYFKQVSYISEAEVDSSENIANSRDIDLAYQESVKSYNFSDSEIIRLAKVYKKYIYLQPEIEKKIKNDIKNLLHDVNGKVLAAHVRGADWRKMKVDGHPIVSSEEYYIELIDDIMSNNRFDILFLATDSDSTIEKFKKKFKDKLYWYNDTNRTPQDGDSLVIFDETKNPCRLGYEIIRDIYTLAYCDSLIAGISYVSYVARIIKASYGEQFIKLKIVDNGVFSSNMSLKSAERKQRKHSKK